MNVIVLNGGTIDHNARSMIEPYFVVLEQPARRALCIDSSPPRGVRRFLDYETYDFHVVAAMRISWLADLNNKGRDGNFHDVAGGVISQVDLICRRVLIVLAIIQLAQIQHSEKHSVIKIEALGEVAGSIVTFVVSLADRPRRRIGHSGNERIRHSHHPVLSGHHESRNPDRAVEDRFAFLDTDQNLTLFGADRIGKMTLSWLETKHGSWTVSVKNPLHLGVIARKNDHTRTPSLSLILEESKYSYANEKQVESILTTI